MGGEEPLNGVYPVICKMLFPLFFLISDLGITLGGGGSSAGRVMVAYGFREDSRTPPTDPAPQGLSLHKVASWVPSPETQSVRLWEIRVQGRGHARDYGG